MSGQGKYDSLTQELITHLLGFKEGEENFIRSEQYVLSNLLYHHCLAVNSHAVRRSLDGIALKFSVHGQHQRAATLQRLTAAFLASQHFQHNYETDLEWSLLSLLLHLSHSPTQVPLAHGEALPTLPRPLQPPREEEELDWAAFLREDDPDYILGPEEPLSDWSGDEDSEGTRNPPRGPPGTQDTLTQPCPGADLPAVTPSPAVTQLQGAKAWLSSQTHLQYWGARRPQELPASAHPLACVAKLWEASSGRGRQHQQLSEWAVMREVVWSLLCPGASHVFLPHPHTATYTVSTHITLPSLTPSATQGLLGHLCGPLQQLEALDAFTHAHRSPRPQAPGPVTLLAYASGLRHWRQALDTHLRALEDAIKAQESSCTLVWLRGELAPWLHTLAHLYTLHCQALTLPPQATPRTTAMRLLGSLCEGVEGAEGGVVRGVVVRLLLHSLRPYLCVTHAWLTHGSLHDPAREYCVHRDEGVTVYDPGFWRHAFTVSREDATHSTDPAQNPGGAIMSILAPLLPLLTSVGKTQELLAALGAPPLPLHTHTHTHTHTDCSLEEIVVRYIKDAVCKLSEEGEEEEEEERRQENREGTEGGNKENKENKEEEEEERRQKNSGGNRGGNKESSGVLRASQDQMDPLLWAAFTETPQDSTTQETDLTEDPVASLIEDIPDICAAVSVSSLLTSALRPLVQRRQGELSAVLGQVVMGQHHLAHHCQALRSIMLLQAGDVMHEFYSNLFAKLECGCEGVDSLSLTLHLQYCVSRLYPALAQHFSLSMLKAVQDTPSDATHTHAQEDNSTATAEMNNRRGTVEEAEMNNRVLPIEEAKMSDPKHSNNCKVSAFSLTQAGIPELQIHYQAPWPVNLLLTECVMRQYNKLFNFSLSLKRVTHGLERLQFKELSSWNLIQRWEAEESSSSSGSSSKGGPHTPLQSRLHRLQLLRQWLLCFSRQLHDHFANTAFLPFYEAMDGLFLEAPSLNTVITEHERLMDKLTTECLMGREDKVLPLQVVLNKVFVLTQELRRLWLGDVSRVSADDLTRLEAQYSRVHRYLVHFLTTLTARTFTPHLEGLTRTLVDTVPLLTHM